MDTRDLIVFLLDNRYRYSDKVAFDCLELARQTRKRGRPIIKRYTVNEMKKWLNCSAPSLSRRLSDLGRHGLLDYERGTSACSGYLIRRVGPAPEPREGATIQKPHHPRSCRSLSPPNCPS